MGDSEEPEETKLQDEYLDVEHCGSSASIRTKDLLKKRKSDPGQLTNRIVVIQPSIDSNMHEKTFDDDDGDDDDRNDDGDDDAENDENKDGNTATNVQQKRPRDFGSDYNNSSVACSGSLYNQNRKNSDNSSKDDDLTPASNEASPRSERSTSLCSRNLFSTRSLRYPSSAGGGGGNMSVSSTSGGSTSGLANFSGCTTRKCVLTLDGYSYVIVASTPENKTRDDCSSTASSSLAKDRRSIQDTSLSKTNSPTTSCNTQNSACPINGQISKQGGLTIVRRSNSRKGNLSYQAVAQSPSGAFSDQDTGFGSSSTASQQTPVTITSAQHSYNPNPNSNSSSNSTSNNNNYRTSDTNPFTDTLIGTNNIATTSFSISNNRTIDQQPHLTQQQHIDSLFSTDEYSSSVVCTTTEATLITTTTTTGTTSILTAMIRSNTATSPTSGAAGAVAQSSGGSAGSVATTASYGDIDIETIDLTTDQLPAVDTPDACDKAAVRLRCLLRLLQRGEISAEVLQKNLHYAARVLEAVFIDETNHNQENSEQKSGQNFERRDSDQDINIDTPAKDTNSTIITTQIQNYSNKQSLASNNPFLSNTKRTNNASGSDCSTPPPSSTLLGRTKGVSTAPQTHSGPTGPPPSFSNLTRTNSNSITIDTSSDQTASTVYSLNQQPQQQQSSKISQNSINTINSISNSSNNTTNNSNSNKNILLFDDSNNCSSNTIISSDNVDSNDTNRDGGGGNLESGNTNFDTNDERCNASSATTTTSTTASIRNKVSSQTAQYNSNKSLKNNITTTTTTDTPTNTSTTDTTNNKTNDVVNNTSGNQIQDNTDDSNKQNSSATSTNCNDNKNSKASTTTTPQRRRLRAPVWARSMSNKIIEIRHASVQTTPPPTAASSNANTSYKTSSSMSKRSSFSKSELSFHMSGRLADEDDELSEVQPDAVPPEVREWLASTFTRQLATTKKRSDEKPKFRSVAHAIRAGIFVDRIYRRVSSSALMQFPPEVVKVLKNLDDWSFDVFALAEAANSQPVKYLGYDLLNRYGIIHKFKISPTVLETFLTRIEDGYCRFNNPYHNNLHAADVTQTTHHILCQTGLMNWLTDLEIFATLLAALIHDYEHTGTTNNFHVMSGSETAMLYNDRAVLENHHISAAFRVIKEDDCNVLANLSREEYRELRTLVIDMVLSTDMSFHFQQLKNMKNLLTLDSPTVDKSKALALVLHCCDISHPAKKWTLHHRWTKLLLEEFFRQGDLERDLGLPFSPLCDRNNTLVAESQIGFIDFIVDPSMSVCADMLEYVLAPIAPIRTNVSGSSGEDGSSKPPTNSVSGSTCESISENSETKKNSGNGEQPQELGPDGKPKFKIRKPWAITLAENKKIWKEQAVKDAEARAAAAALAEANAEAANAAENETKHE